MITFQEDTSPSYTNRTRINASADATIAFAQDFETGGERLTKKSVFEKKKLYISVNYSNDIFDYISLQSSCPLVDIYVQWFNERGVKTLNIAGNSLSTLKKKVSCQQEVDDFTFKWLSRLLNHKDLSTKIISIRSGGQSGFDEAGIKAAVKLGIPAIVLAPKGWKFRNIDSIDICNERKFKERFENL